MPILMAQASGKKKKKGKKAPTTEQGPAAEPAPTTKKGSKKKGAATTEEAAPKKVKSKAAATGSSSKHKSIGIAGVGGFYFSTFGGGGELFFAPNKYFQLVGQFVFGTNEAAAEGGDTDLREFLSYTVLDSNLKARVFIFQGLYLAAGVGYASISGEYGFINPKDEAYTVEYSTGAVLGKASIGYQYVTPGGFFFGVDAAGYNMFLSNTPTVSEQKKVNAADPDVFEAGKEPVDVVADALSRQLQFELGMAYIGFAF